MFERDPCHARSGGAEGDDHRQQEQQAQEPGNQQSSGNFFLEYFRQHRARVLRKRLNGFFRAQIEEILNFLREGAGADRRDDKMAVFRADEHHLRLFGGGKNNRSKPADGAGPVVLPGQHKSGQGHRRVKVRDRMRPFDRVQGDSFALKSPVQLETRTRQPVAGGQEQETSVNQKDKGSHHRHRQQ